MSMEVGASDHLSFDGRRLVLPSGMTATEQLPGGGDVTLSNGGLIAVLNAKTQYGAVGDVKIVADGAITSGTTSLASATGSFSPSDVGKYISVEGAGAAGVTLSTTVAAYVSATQVTLADAASTTVTGKDVTWGTDDTTAIQNAITASAAQGIPAYLPPGAYLISSALTLTYKASLYGAGSMYQESSGTRTFPVLTTVVLKAASNSSMLVTDTTGPVRSAGRRWQRSIVKGICFDGTVGQQTVGAPVISGLNSWGVYLYDVSTMRTSGHALKLVNCNEWRVADCAFVCGSTAPGGIYLVDSADCIFTGTNVGSCAGPVVMLEGSSVGTQSCWKNVFDNCLIFNAKVASGNEYGIYLKNAQSNVFTSSRVDQNYSDGVYVDANSYANDIDVTVLENGLANGTGMAGVRVLGTANRISGTAQPGPTGNQTLGVVLAANADNNIVEMVASGHSSADYSVSATGTASSVILKQMRPRPDLALRASGVLSETVPVVLCSTSNSPSTQQVAGSLIGLRKGDVVTGLLLRLLVAAAGVDPTSAKVGLADATGKVLVLSADVKAAANWAAGPSSFAFTAPYTVLADGGYYAFVWVNGVWGTTQPTLISAPSVNAIGQAAFGSNAPPSFRWNGQSSLPAIGASLTLTSGGQIPYYIAAYA